MSEKGFILFENESWANSFITQVLHACTGIKYNGGANVYCPGAEIRVTFGDVTVITTLLTTNTTTNTDNNHPMRTTIRTTHDTNVLLDNINNIVIRRALL
jgi:hypothetical protein